MSFSANFNLSIGTRKLEVQQIGPFQVGGSLWSPAENNRYLRRSRTHRDQTWARIGSVGSLAGEVEDMWPILRLVVDMGQPLSEVEKWDLDDIRYFNSILDMRRDCEAAADAYQAMQMEQMRRANERRR